MLQVPYFGLFLEQMAIAVGNYTQAICSNRARMRRRLRNNFQDWNRMHAHAENADHCDGMRAYLLSKKSAWTFPPGAPFVGPCTVRSLHVSSRAVAAIARTAAPQSACMQPACTLRVHTDKATRGGQRCGAKACTRCAQCACMPAARQASWCLQLWVEHLTSSGMLEFLLLGFELGLYVAPEFKMVFGYCLRVLDLQHHSLHRLCTARPKETKTPMKKNKQKGSSSLQVEYTHGTNIFKTPIFSLHS
jgi:hypothetical protein